jgi:ankyrin repeat protein
VFLNLFQFSIFQNSFPLPEDHWINQTIENEEKSFLIYSIEDVDDVGFCRKLISVGADVNVYDVEMDQAPIHAAVYTESTDKVRALIENSNNRADINAVIQHSGQSVIHIAAEKGELKLSSPFVKTNLFLNKIMLLGYFPLNLLRLYGGMGVNCLAEGHICPNLTEI